jgi:hypothetical protein
MLAFCRHVSRGCRTCSECREVACASDGAGRVIQCLASSRLCVVVNVDVVVDFDGDGDGDGNVTCKR